ncbi:EF2 [Enterospora canceri]|uniref:Elongation factor 2 n=1 Tax=Enterospora canceri TaxID=1081671 RepID=A0A1Y1S786_9MICR|nr:EF2 [Enterospora canceri]
MVDYQTEKIHELMKNTKNIRNISVIAHVDHGKSTLTDCLLIKARIASKEAQGERYMDTRKDEQERGITIKSTAVSMSFSVEQEILEAYAKKESYEGREFLINLIDSPGHVDFSSEVTAALRVTDGALVVVDSIDGICVQTETVLRQAIDEKIIPTLVLNKLDRAILELGYGERELYEVLKKRVEMFNAKMESILGERDYIKSISPKENEISFCSGLQGWGFTLNKFARFYLKHKGTHTFDKEKAFAKVLWSVKHYCDFDDEFASDYKFEKIVGGEIPKGKKAPFEMFVLGPIYKVKDWCFDGKIGEIKAYLKQFGIDFSKANLEAKPKGKNLFAAVFKAWLPAAECLLEQIVLKLPNPHAAQNIRADYLYTGPQGDETHQAIKNCVGTDDAPVTIYISKMVPDASNGFVAVGRVLSGNIKPGMKVYVQNPNYLPDPESKKNPNVTQKTIAKVCVMMGRSSTAIPNCPAGNIVGLVGVEGFLKKTGTITTVKHGYNIKTMKFSVSPVVKVAVAPKRSQDLSHFKEGLEKLGKSDPLCVIEYNDKGQATIACAGELHLEIILHDLGEFYAKCEFTVEKPQVKYYEGFCGEVEKPIMTKSANKHNRIYMTCEPLDERIIANVEQVNVKDPKLRNQRFREVLNIDDDWVKKIMFFAPEVEPMNMMVDHSKGIQYLNEVKDHIYEGMKLGTKEGPLIGEPVKGCRFNLTDVVLHSDAIHRGANQMVRPVEQAIRGLVLKAVPILYEPMFLCTVTVPEEFATLCERVITKRRGYVDEFELENNYKTFKAFLPVQASFGLNKSLREKSRGFSVFSLSFDHYAECPGSLEATESVMAKTVAEVREYKKINTKLDADSYFDTL